MHRFKVHVDGFQVNRHRGGDFSDSLYFVDKPSQVEILFVIEVRRQAVKEDIWQDVKVKKEEKISKFFD